MRHIAVSVLSFIYILGAGFSEPSKPLAPSIQIQVEHTHEVTDGHDHHHDFENDGGHEDHGEASHHHHRQAEHKHSVPHSHEVSVSMANACILNSPAGAAVSVVILPPALISILFNEAAPKDISLNTLLRPPIV